MATRAAKAAEAAAAAGGPAVNVVLRRIDDLRADDLLARPHGGGSDALWKLYPWEWLINEQLGEAYCEQHELGTALGTARLGMASGLDASAAASAAALLAAGVDLSGAIPAAAPAREPRRCERSAPMHEPPWKLLMSSKAMLSYLWAKHPGHKNLLPAAMADDLPGGHFVGRHGSLRTSGGHSTLGSACAADFVSKPAFGREGHGLLYGDETAIGGVVRPDADVQAFASAVVRVPGGEHGSETTTMPMVAPPPELPVEGLSYIDVARRLAEQQASSAMSTAQVGVSSLLERGNLAKRAGELDKTVEMHVGPNVLQRYYALPTLMGRKVVTSAWVVRGICPPHPNRWPSECF